MRQGAFFFLLLLSNALMGLLIGFEVGFPFGFAAVAFAGEWFRHGVMYSKR